MVPLLGPTDHFPPVDRALADPNGLLAAGGGLGVERLIDAYARGIFPWFSEGDPVLWWSPDPRTVLGTSSVHLSRSLRRRMRRTDYEVTMDREFPQVMRACAGSRRGESGTWLIPSMMRAYQRLHDVGIAHSIEVWIGRTLVGGLYGVALGCMFYGESMFSRRSDGSKIALVVLAAQLARWQFPIIDCQMETAHLATLGAIPIARAEFVRLIERLVEQPPVPSPWTLDEDVMAQFR